SSTSTAVADSAGRATTSTPVICGSVAPDRTASNIVCTAGEGVWCTMSRRAMAATLPSAAVRPGLRAPHQPARPLAGGLVVLPHDDAPLDRGDVALGRLGQPLAAGREALDHPGPGDAQGAEAVEVEDGQVAACDQPPGVEAEQGGVGTDPQVDRV